MSFSARCIDRIKDSGDNPDMETIPIWRPIWNSPESRRQLNINTVFSLSFSSSFSSFFLLVCVFFSSFFGFVRTSSSERALELPQQQQQQQHHHHHHLRVAGPSNTIHRVNPKKTQPRKDQNAFFAGVQI